ncbi:hypothetical protein PMI35_05284, partial [Pseudomonas sp. GM78]
MVSGEVGSPKVSTMSPYTRQPCVRSV